MTYTQQILRTACAGACVFFLTTAPAMSASPELAIGGYDPVAYFTDGEPRRGKAAHTTEWNGARWIFATAENKKRFLRDPERYAAQYNGWCAFAMAKGYVAEVDPVNAWTIYDGKLYLNWSSSVKSRWERRKGRYVTRGDKNWPGVKSTIVDGTASISRK